MSAEKVKVVSVWNNAGVRSECGVCHNNFKPGIGFYPFLSENGVPDYGAPVCYDCVEQTEEEPLDPEVAASQPPADFYV